MNEDIFYQLLGARIAEIRLRRGVKQEELADHLKLSRVSIVNMEKGRQRPSVYMLVSIAAYLNTNLLDFMPTSESNDAYSFENIKVVAGAGLDSKLANSDFIQDFFINLRINK